MQEILSESPKGSNHSCLLIYLIYMYLIYFELIFDLSNLVNTIFYLVFHILPQFLPISRSDW